MEQKSTSKGSSDIFRDMCEVRVNKVTSWKILRRRQEREAVSHQYNPGCLQTVCEGILTSGKTDRPCFYAPTLIMEDIVRLGQSAAVLRPSVAKHLQDIYPAGKLWKGSAKQILQRNTDNYGAIEGYIKTTSMGMLLSLRGCSRSLVRTEREPRRERQIRAQDQIETLKIWTRKVIQILPVLEKGSYHPKWPSEKGDRDRKLERQSLLGWSTRCCLGTGLH